MTVSESALVQDSHLQTSMYGRHLEALGALYCRLFHKSISRPVQGKYRCWKCLRQFELEWRVDEARSAFDERCVSDWPMQGASRTGGELNWRHCF